MNISKSLLSIFLAATLATTSSCNKATKPRSAYTGEDLSRSCTVSRDRATKIPSITLSSSIQGPWRLYSGHSFETTDFSRPLQEGVDGNRSFSFDHITGHTVFTLITKNGSAVYSEKHLPMEGGYNFRDMGGIRAKDGRFVKWGKVIRADEMGNLTDGDMSYLASFPLTSVIDFRSLSESEFQPDRLPSTVVDHIKLPITPGDLSAKSIDELISSADFDSAETMRQLNISLVCDNLAIKTYKHFFEVLQDHTSSPMLFHCTAGKDRAGMAAALFLYSLGVDEELILEDYLLSNHYLESKYGLIIDQYPIARDLLTAEKSFIMSGLDSVKTLHGSVENYLTHELSVDLDLMKDLYLYPQEIIE